MDERIKATREALRECIARWTNESDQYASAIPGLFFFRQDELTEPMSVVYEPSICMVVQGAKRVLLGNEPYVYDDNHYLITSVNLPTFVKALEASKEKPLLGLKLTFDIQEVSQLLIDSNFPHHR